MKRVALYRILTLLLIFAGCAFARENGWFQHIDHAITEQRMSTRSIPASGKIVLLEIDNKSLTSIGIWPWKRSIYADIIRKTFEAGADEIAFDIDFSSEAPDGQDTVFAQALEEAPGPVTLAVFQQFATARMNPDNLRINRPTDLLADRAWLATVNVIADTDGFVRTFPLAQNIGGELFPSLTSTLGNLQDIVADSQIINFNINPDSIPTYSVIDLLEGSIPEGALKNRKVLIGAGAAELRDTMAVPVFGVISGPKLQIIAAENLLQGNAVRNAPHSWIYFLAALLALPLLFILIFKNFNTYSRIIGLIGLAAGVELLGYRLYTDQNLLLDTGMLLATLLSSVVALTLTEISFKSLLLNLSHKHGESITDLLNTVVKDSLTGIVIAGGNGRIIGISQQAVSIFETFGYRSKKGDKTFEALPWEFGKRIKECLDSPDISKAPTGLQFIEIKRQQETRYFEYSITPSFIAPDGDTQQKEDKVVTLLFHDVTEARREQMRLERLADHDQLTDLYNLQGFCNRLENTPAYQADKASALVFACEARRLDKVNQMLGPDYCDILVRQIGKALSSLTLFDAVGCTDDKVFLLYKQLEAPQDLDDLKSAIMKCLDQTYDLRGHGIIAGGLLGIASFDSDAMQTAKDVAEASIIALDRARETGESNILYSPNLAKEVERQRLLEREILGAFEREEFQLYYQPQVDLKSRETVGCEALARWKHRELGLIRPDHFIPILEETGKIVELGRWIMKTACIEAMKWPKPISVAVNVSAVQFQRSNILQDLEQALTISGLPRERLHMEITESLFIADSEDIIRQLTAIRDHGIKIALDDFGTGYSSLSYIHRFPLDKIKIDRAFVKDLPYSMDSLAVINAVTALAHGMDIKIIAEGMENEEQANVLALAGCHQGQGFFFGKPMEFNEFFAFLDTKNQKQEKSNYTPENWLYR
nr:EAL domain-containing protein [uncultured Cohaesibacter sp.]